MIKILRLREINLFSLSILRYVRPKAYIVSQNPLDNTIADFWRMIFEQKICYIVCLCDGDPDMPVRYH